MYTVILKRASNELLTLTLTAQPSCGEEWTATQNLEMPWNKLYNLQLHKL